LCRSEKNVENDQWNHNAITLKPLSTDSAHKSIELSESELEGLKVIGVFEKVLA